MHDNVSHSVDYIKYKLTGNNISPYGSSSYVDQRPMVSLPSVDEAPKWAKPVGAKEPTQPSNVMQMFQAIVPPVTFAAESLPLLGMLTGKLRDPLRAKWSEWENAKFSGNGRFATAEEEQVLLQRTDALWKKQKDLEDKSLRPAREFLLDKAKQFRGNKFMQSFVDNLSWDKKRELDDLTEAQSALERFESRIEDRIERKGSLTIGDIEWANKHLQEVEDQLEALSTKETRAQIAKRIAAKQDKELVNVKSEIADFKPQSSKALQELSNLVKAREQLETKDIPMQVPVRLIGSTKTRRQWMSITPDNIPMVKRGDDGRRR